jgi:hypothetical protein
VGRIFLDRERRLGIGWRLLSYLVMVVVATAAVAAVIAGTDPPVGRNLLAHLVAVAPVVAVTWLYRRRVDRRGWRDLGLPLPGRTQLRASAAGFGLGVLSIVGFFGVVWVLGWARVDGGEVAERGVAKVLALLAAGLVMYAASARWCRSWPSAATSSRTWPSGCRSGTPPSSPSWSSPPCTWRRSTSSRRCSPSWGSSTSP